MDARARTPGWPAGLLQVTLLVVDGVRFRRDMARGHDGNGHDHGGHDHGGHDHGHDHH